MSVGLAGIQYGQTDLIVRRQIKKKKGKLKQICGHLPSISMNVTVRLGYLKLRLAWTLIHDSECLCPGYLPVLLCSQTLAFGICCTNNTDS